MTAATAVTEVLGAPELAPEARDALPPRRSVFLCRLASFSAGAVALTVVVLATRGSAGSGDPGEATRLAGWLAPWILALPWLKHLDIRPVPWFFWSLLFGLIAAPVLACRVAYRAASLPYRDWSVEYWHGDRVRAVSSERALVVLARGSVPEVRDPRRLRRLEAAQRAGWVVVMVTLLVEMVTDGAIDQWIPDWLGLVMFAGLIALMLSHIVVVVLLSERSKRRTQRAL